MTGVQTSMELGTTLEKKEPLADRFSRLWQDGVSTPDVFAFLAAHADALSIDRLEVLLADQAGAGSAARRCPCESTSPGFRISRRTES